MVFTPQTNVFTILLQSVAEKVVAFDSPGFYNKTNKNLIKFIYLPVMLPTDLQI